MLDWKLVTMTSLVVAAFGAVIPIGLRMMFGARVGTRWVQNWHSASTFMLSAYPIAVGLFVATITVVPPLAPTDSARVVMIVSLIFAIVVAIGATYDDLVNEDVLPVVLNTGGGRVVETLRSEMKLRRLAREQRYESPRCKTYAHLVRPFGSIRGVRQRGNWLAYMLFLINLHGAVFLATLIWYIVVLWLWNRTAVQVVQPLVVVAGLFATWFLFRRYAQWYQFAIYKARWAGVQPIYFLMFIPGLVGAGLLYHFGHEFPTIILGSVLGGLWAFIKAAEKFNWKWANSALAAVADWLTGWRFAHYAVVYASLLALFVAVADTAIAPPPVDAAVTDSAQVKQASQAATDAPAVRVVAKAPELIVDYGPLAAAEHASHDGPQTPPAVFMIPDDGWLRGFAVELLDSTGQRLSNRMLHHLNVIAAGRRDLFSNEMMRIAAAGPETSEITLPRFLGVRVHRGDTLAMVVLVHRLPGTNPGPVTLRLRSRFLPKASMVGAMAVYPMSMAIGVRGQPNLFDLPPGRSEHHWEGSPAVGGRILGLSGHLHRYGVLLRLEDRTAGKTLWEARPRIGTSGEVLGLPVTSLLSKLGVPIRADHVYGLTAVYQNPTNDTVRADGMGVIGGVLLPRRKAQWPSVDRKHPEYLADAREIFNFRPTGHAH